MPRSIYTNTLIGECLFSGMSVIVDDTEEEHTCKTFKEVANIIDSVDECYIYLKKSDTTNENVASFFLVMDNDDEDQLSDYTDNKLSNAIVDQITRLRELRPDLTYHSFPSQQRLMGGHY